MTPDAPQEPQSPVDVQALVAEIRSEAESKRRALAAEGGAFDELDALLGNVRTDSLDSAVRRVRQSAAFSPSVPTASRKGAAAPVASAFKRAVRASTSWYLSAILQQVEVFADQTANAIALLAEHLNRMEGRSADLASRLTGVQDSVQAVTDALETLKAEAADDRIRDRLALLERSVRGIRERLAGEGPLPAPATERWKASGSDLSIDYLDFENQFRGTEAEILERQRSYVAIFDGADKPVVDVGCGRGEFLELLRAEGIESYGVDRHPDMVDVCREKGLQALESDALGHLAGVAEGSLGGIFCAQMIEHLDVRDVPRFFELAASALGSGGRLVVETINPESLIVFARSFYLDLGHLRPLHPLTLSFLAEKSGFREVRVEFSSLPPDDVRLTVVPKPDAGTLDAQIEAINENFHRLDNVVFGPQDYAVVAVR